MLSEPTICYPLPPVPGGRPYPWRQRCLFLAWLTELLVADAIIASTRH